MAEPDALKAAWAVDLPGGQPDKVGLARIVDEDGGRDEAENEYYEAAADPGYVGFEAARRRFRGQYFRRLRRLSNRVRHSSGRNRALDSTALEFGRLPRALRETASGVKTTMVAFREAVVTCAAVRS